ncbi:hypothetical protein [Lacihabitans soyangensis]|uniref:Uncharacterized protein n=1 Tax=Lacihabitans soyangensis TaxID=869394 RepID=A0AAE3KTH2_9BACT|nr:hypothetical protein [Lacihabitans soyangensis]MCP9764078.1 hypothetical protein [Lacihabitans soyangensis]
MTDEDILTILENVKQLLQDNQFLKVGDLTFNLKENRELVVIGWTNYIHFENLTKRQSLIELNEIKDLFRLMLNSSKYLADFVENKTIKYFLNYDDSGKCGIGICSEENGQIFWQAQLRED